MLREREAVCVCVCACVCVCVCVRACGRRATRLGTGGEVKATAFPKNDTVAAGAQPRKQNSVDQHLKIKLLYLHQWFYEEPRTSMAPFKCRKGSL